MKIAVPSYQVKSGYMPVCWSGTSLAYDALKAYIATIIYARCFSNQQEIKRMNK